MIPIRPMTDADLAFGLALSRQAGWNQTPADWQRAFHLEPDACFIAEPDGVPAGTATACLFGTVAWVALVLVDERFRRRGVGRALLGHTLAFLDARNVRTVRLDATPLGQPLYEQLGFVVQYALARYEGTLPEGLSINLPQRMPAEVSTVSEGQWDELAVLDEQVTRTDRRKLLAWLFREQPGEVRGVKRDGEWRGVLAARPGARALQLGPCVGEAGAVLLADAARRHAGRRVYLDVPLDNKPTCRLAEGLGLDVQRHLTRMVRGEPVLERVDLLWASSGPEKG